MTVIGSEEHVDAYDVPVRDSARGDAVDGALVRLQPRIPGARAGQ
ncbi:MULTISPECIES: hypothetical protein [Arthrobacter]|nr:MULTISPECIES: hypothetical protein [Arthrobacter]